MYNLQTIKKKRKTANFSLDERTPKTLISHLSTIVNLIQYFCSFSLLFKSHAYFKDIT